MYHFVSGWMNGKSRFKIFSLKLIYDKPYRGWIQSNVPRFKEIVETYIDWLSDLLSILLHYKAHFISIFCNKVAIKQTWSNLQDRTLIIAVWRRISNYYIKKKIGSQSEAFLRGKNISEEKITLVRLNFKPIIVIYGHTWELLRVYLLTTTNIEI